MESALERFEMIFSIGSLIIGVLAYVGLAIACFVISSKKKYKNPADSKTWKTLGIILVAVAGFCLVAMLIMIPLTIYMVEAQQSAIFIM